MKNSSRALKITLTLCFFVSCIYSANKKTPRADSLKCIEINARIYNLSSEQGGYKVEFLSGSHVDSVITVNKAEFKFLLEKGQHCALRISKNNIIIRQINLFTNDPEKDKELERLHFHTDLVFDKDTDGSGFPIGMVSIKSKLKTYSVIEFGHSRIKKLEVVAK
jgi:hypothetical protein